MRIRRKKHLFERLDAVKDYIIELPKEIPPKNPPPDEPPPKEPPPKEPPLELPPELLLPCEGPTGITFPP